LLLLGCGGNTGGGGAAPIYPERQFGVTEAELKDASNNPNGTVVGRGSGMVVMRIEPAGGQPAPPVGDSAVTGVDTLWIDVDYPGTVSVDLTGDARSVVSKVEVLRDEHDMAPLLSANAATPKASVTLAVGRYLLRLTAASGATQEMQGMVWFGGASKAVNAADLQKVNAGSCTGCNLQGANLSGIDLQGKNLSNSDLRQALLVRVSGGLTLNGTDILAFFFGSSAVRGADLSGANLSGTRLDGAYLSGSGGSPANLAGVNLASASLTDVFLAGADLHGAGLAHANFSRSVLTNADLQGASLANAVFTNADLSGANLLGVSLSSTVFTGANLSHATWVNGHVCAAGSVGACL
jgi:uncharacterized protein YjbI with pentapeptide repeats